MVPRSARPLGLLALWALVFGACRVPYTAPPPRPERALRATSLPAPDPSAARARINELEDACRGQLRAQLVQSSQEAVDRLRLSLGTICDVQSVGSDPLHWLFRCRYDAFFELGSYHFRHDPSVEQECVALAGIRPGRINRWACAGAVLQNILREAGAAFERVDLAMVGHVDQVCVEHFDGCEDVRRYVGFEPQPAWRIGRANTQDEALAANNGLAWCRAGNVARYFRCGMRLAQQGAADARRRGSGDPCATMPAEGTQDRVRVSVLSASTSWQQAHRNECSTPPPNASPGYCAEARRVDVFVRFVPNPRDAASACTREHTSPAAALACLEECVQQSGTRGMGPASRPVPLHLGAGERGEGVPASAGWYCLSLPTHDATCSDLNFGAIENTLGISRNSTPRCERPGTQAP